MFSLKNPAGPEAAARRRSRPRGARLRDAPALLGSLCVSAVKSWLADYAPSMGAAISFYTVFSIPSVLVIVMAIERVLFDRAAAERQIVDQIGQLVGPAGSAAIHDLLLSAADPKRSGLAAFVGVVVLLVGATSVFAELQRALDRIWRAPARNETGAWRIVRERVLSFGMVLGIGFLLAVSLSLSAWLSAAGIWFGPVFGPWRMAEEIFNGVFSFGVVTLLFAMIYKLLPKVSVGWRDVWVGALVTALLFEVGKKLIGLYLGASHAVSGFGAAASLAVLMLWVYYSAQVFLLGAEFTWVYAHRLGSLEGQDITHA
jgi:membrane protein